MTTNKFVYIGQGGEHHSGIPARDLSADDWTRLSDEQKAVVASSPLYRATDEGNTDKRKGAKAQRS